MAQPEYLDVLRLSSDDIKDLLRKLDRTESADTRSGMRTEPRLPFCGHVALLEIRYPTDHIGTYQAVARNISNKGLALLHGKFVYPGSPCDVILRRRGDDGEVRVTGVVARCNHLSGRVHDVGITFEEPIVAEDFEDRPEEEAPPASGEEAATTGEVPDANAA